MGTFHLQIRQQNNETSKIACKMYPFTQADELLKSANFKVGYTLCSLLNYIMISVSWNASDFETVSFLLAFGFCVFLCGADQSDSLIQIFPV